MPEAPRLRRLRADRRALEQLKADSSLFDFVARGDLPDTYTLIFNGRGVWRADNSSPVQLADRHEVYLRLGAAYPRMMPELTWRSPIFHPNISASGVVCLGGYGTYWVPSLSLDELCTMLWDMIRYANYDPNSPYNREAAIWAKQQKDFRFPLDLRPIRDRVAAKKNLADLREFESAAQPVTLTPPPVAAPIRSPARPQSAALPAPPVASANDIMYLEDVEIVEAEVLEDERGSADEPEIVFID